MNSSPWVPLFTIERSGQPEVVVSGIISVVAGNDKAEREALLAVGDVDYQLWSRSVLKPWQLLSHLLVLKENYPDLQDRHFALIAASHNAESEHLCVLREILEIGRLEEEVLKCPASMPLHAETRMKFRQECIAPRPLFHNCSGKHLGYLLAIKAQRGELDTYLHPKERHFTPLKELLGALLGRASSSFLATTDGCRLPNYAMSACETAHIYRTLVAPQSLKLNGNLAASVQATLKSYPEVYRIIIAHPELVGGTGRVDTNIMLGNVAASHVGRKLVAKQGADGFCRRTVQMEIIRKE